VEIGNIDINCLENASPWLPFLESIDEVNLNEEIETVTTIDSNFVSEEELRTLNPSLVD
jgi:hypothetical protein